MRNSNPLDHLGSISEWSPWLTEAKELAREAAANDEVPVGAVVIFNGKVIGRGRNRREANQDPLCHAELEAISEASRHLGSWRLEDCTVLVTLEPCPMCLGALQQARVARVVYGCHDLKGGAISLGYSIHEDPRSHHRFSVFCLDDQESSQMLTEFFRGKRKKIDL